MEDYIKQLCTLCTAARKVEKDCLQSPLSINTVKAMTIYFCNRLDLHKINASHNYNKLLTMIDLSAMKHLEARKTSNDLGALRSSCIDLFICMFYFA